MRTISIAALVALTLVLGDAWGGRIEGHFWPVVRPGVISAHSPVGETRTRFWGHASRLRNCSFDHIVWFLGDPVDQARADLAFEEGTKVRGDGAFTFGPWVVQLTPDQLFHRSYAIVYHRCHPLWLTETRFYG